jgi:hypothetical protein
MKNEKIFLISYFPLIDTDGLIPGSYTKPEEGMEDLQKRLNESHPTGRADGVMWVYYPFDVEVIDKDTAVIPVLIIERADEIVDHLIKWSENEIERRFNLYICGRQEGYLVMLAPDIQQSIQRWKSARFIFHEDAAPNDDFEILFSPLVVVCPHGQTYDQVKSRISNPTILGFIDPKKIDKNNPSNFDASNVRIVGPLEISGLGMENLIDGLFEEALNEE